MANTTTVSMPFITVLFDGSTSWDVSDLTGYSHLQTKGMRVVSMTMIPNAAGDAITVRNTSSANKTSAKMMQAMAISPYDQPQRLGFAEGQYSFPAVHADEVSASVQLLIEVKA